MAEPARLLVREAVAVPASSGDALTVEVDEAAALAVVRGDQVRPAAVAFAVEYAQAVPEPDERVGAGDVVRQRVEQLAQAFEAGCRYAERGGTV